MQAAIHRLSAFGNRSDANRNLFHLRVPGVNLRREMVLTDDVWVCEYDTLLIPLHTQKVMSIRFKYLERTMRFLRIRLEQVSKYISVII